MRGSGGGDRIVRKEKKTPLFALNGNSIYKAILPDGDRHVEGLPLRGRILLAPGGHEGSAAGNKGGVRGNRASKARFPALSPKTLTLRPKLCRKRRAGEKIMFPPEIKKPLPHETYLVPSRPAARSRRIGDLNNASEIE